LFQEALALKKINIKINIIATVVISLAIVSAIVWWDATATSPEGEGFLMGEAGLFTALGCKCSTRCPKKCGTKDIKVPEIRLPDRGPVIHSPRWAKKLRIPEIHLSDEEERRWNNLTTIPKRRREWSDGRPFGTSAGPDEPASDYVNIIHFAVPESGYPDLWHVYIVNLTDIEIRATYTVESQNPGRLDSRSASREIILGPGESKFIGPSVERGLLRETVNHTYRLVSTVAV
jgi:hypothetical protein